MREEDLASRLGASVLAHLLAPSAKLREAAAQQLSDQGLVDAGSPHAVVCLRIAGWDTAGEDAGGTEPPLQTVLAESMAELVRGKGQHNLLPAARREHAVVLVQVASVCDDRRAVTAAARARDIVTRRLRAGCPGSPVIAGGRVIAGIGEPRLRLTDSAESYRQAVLAARAAAAVPSLGDVARWPDLGAFRALVQLPPGEDGSSCLDPRLGVLLEAREDLAGKVECYLDFGGDAKRTAEHLHLHRTTLYYRLRKAQDMTAADLRDGHDRLALHLSFKLARLAGTYPRNTPPGS